MCVISLYSSVTSYGRDINDRIQEDIDQNLVTQTDTETDTSTYGGVRGILVSG